MATILKESGAYLQASRPHQYPAKLGYSYDQWLRKAAKVGREWSRIDCMESDPPGEVGKLLDEIGRQVDDGVCLHELSHPTRHDFLWMPYLQLMCLADSASAGIGIYYFASMAEIARSGQNISAVCLQSFRQIGHEINRRNSESSDAFAPVTLCRLVDSSRAIVTPKMRTSQRGITIRSFSHHLALINGTDVEPLWVPTTHLLLKNAAGRGRVGCGDIGAVSGKRKHIATSVGPYNLLMLPWPLTIDPSQFSPMDPHLKCLGGRPPTKNAFFTFKHAEVEVELVRMRIRRLVEKACEKVGPLHGIVLPEMAFTKSQFEQIFAADFPLDVEFVASGIYEPGQDKATLGKNYAIVRRRLANGVYVNFTQQKHHRWALDSSQIKMYSLGSSLRADVTWWEGINIARRSLYFFALDALSAFTVLVCEDLARPDPVADAVRAVGPNLVICLLLDGPQLATRWSARYATVLADDPGSSVLTISSLGMVGLSRRQEKAHESSRIVGLWREAGGVPTELQLPENKQALLLTLTGTGSQEFTLDGRADTGTAGLMHLAGIHALDWDKEG